MSHSHPIIAIDCMGGDHGLPVTVPAAMAFAQSHPDTRCLLVGDEALIRQVLQQNAASAGQFEILHASEVVTMHDSVEVALRRKKDSSMRVAAQAVKDGRADAAVSAGNTGAWMAISRYVLKTLDGIDRPAIATALPNQQGGSTTVLDLGANVDCTAEHLLQFGLMGAALVSAVDRRAQPSVGLLNIGEELIKGNEVVKQAADLLRGSGLNFYGNVEGDDIFKGTVDVVVCDGFVGNVVLKSIEGLARMIGAMMREEFRRNPFTMAAGLVATPVLQRFRARVDNRRYNGAALLGLRGIVIKSHGSADAYAYGQALQRAREAVLNGLLEGTIQRLDALRGRTPPSAAGESAPTA
ncbi:phosphate acyltransferase PlsX [Castellaniella defragrans]|uniref:Phosphate acyltransferase n=1 Tax=Castellaniella defragrans TaxID=75697 RepID=A0A7W9TQH0_CASDE|nr:phosphate acyltransferase PlsX [Castellaniella defragrans]KAB0605619.1 phosphate acyltransferase PlsX [Castellaniella defragrans]MBB6084975.1 glycerol-3-phosphate acyltransferase PlsX [Castellaniella defragrans]